MALKLCELLELDSMKKLRLKAGGGGLGRIVSSIGIADYEFACGVEYDLEEAFEKDSFVISSLLFAKDAPDMILPAVRRLYESGTAGFAYKDILYERLPQEVLDFAEENDYPVFRFGREVFFEKLIYEVTSEICRDDETLLSDGNIRAIIEGRFSDADVRNTARNLSVRFKKFTMAVFAAGKGDTYISRKDMPESFYLNKNLRQKAVICEYERGLFIIMTGNQSEEENFEVILKEILEETSVPQKDTLIYKSLVHRSGEGLGKCIRESYETYLASSIFGKRFENYRQIGVFGYLIPLRNRPELKSFSDFIIKAVEDKDDLFTTLKEYVKNGGDIQKTADSLFCHQNTVRYRLVKIREMSGLADISEFDFYEQAAAAVKIHLLESKKEDM